MKLIEHGGPRFSQTSYSPNLSESGGWDSNPRKSALQADAVAAVPPPHKNIRFKGVLKVVYLCPDS